MKAVREVKYAMQFGLDFTITSIETHHDKFFSIFLQNQCSCRQFILRRISNNLVSTCDPDGCVHAPVNCGRMQESMPGTGHSGILRSISPNGLTIFLEIAERFKVGENWRKVQLFRLL